MTIIPTSNQLSIIDECVAKGRGCISLPMGSGKTLISLSVALKQTNDTILVIVSKTLLGSWVHEIEKFYPDGEIPYEVLHKDSLKGRIVGWAPSPQTRIVLTTSEVVSTAFKECNISSYSISTEPVQGGVLFVNYSNIHEPVLNHQVGLGVLYSRKWGAMILDEIQNYTNISCTKCRSLGALCARYRWGLSGTAFPEPKVERLLGYYYILDLPSPRNVQGMKTYVESTGFGGLNGTMVRRETNADFETPQVNEVIVDHVLSSEEAKVYLAMKDVMQALNKQLREYENHHDHQNARRFSSYLLAMITYFRQALVCPLITITTVALDIADTENRSELSEIFMRSINKLKLNAWLEDPSCILSSRIRCILEQVNVYRKERMVIFSCYRSCIDILMHFLAKEERYNLFTLEAKMSINKRAQVIKDFSSAKRGILLMSFQLGSMGLNLQCASTVLLCDLTWNRDTSKQAIARILRYGQLAKNVNVVTFTSNTQVERSLLTKQKDKLLVYNDLKTGSTDKKIGKINMRSIMDLIETKENERLLTEVNRIES